MPVENEYKYDVFLSFSSKDIEYVRPIQEKLKQSGLKIFFFTEDHKSLGYDFYETIEDALEHSKNFLLVCTSNAMESEWVKEEYKTFFCEFYVKEKKKRRLIILEGEGFTELALPIMSRKLQRTRSVSKIIDILSNCENSQVSRGTTKKRKSLKKSFRLLILSILTVIGYYIFTNLNIDSRLYVSNLSFMDGNNHAPLSREQLRKSIDEAVMKGMAKAKQSPLKYFTLEISETSECMQEMVDITFNPNLTNDEKIENIVQKIMEPEDIDAIISGFYVYHDPFVTLRPFLLIKETKKIIIKNLKFSKSQLFCRDLIKREKILCENAEQKISQAVKELILNFKLENTKIKRFPFLLTEVKDFSIWKDRDYSLMKDKEEEELVGRAILQGIYDAQNFKYKDERLVINAPGHLLRNSDGEVNNLVNIFTNLNFTWKDKVNKIITEVLEPHGVDILVTGEYVESPDESVITFRPMVIIKDLKKIIIRSFNLKRKEIENTSPGKKNLLSKKACAHIAEAIQEMLEEL